MTKICKKKKIKKNTHEKVATNLSPPTVKKLFYHLKSGVKTLFWPTMKCFIFLNPGREWQR